LHLDPYFAAFFFLASGVSAYLCTQKLIPLGEPALRTLSGLTLWELIQILPVQVLATAQLLGIVGRVTVALLAGSQALVLAAALAWVAAHRGVSQPLFRWPRTHKVWPRYLLAAAFVIFCSYLVFAIDIFSSFPNGSDALTYHLPVALRWLQSGSLAIPASRVWRFSLPGNTEIGMMILLATGKDSAVVLVNWLALAVLAISTYLLAKRITQAISSVGLLITLLVLTIPMVEFQALSAYVDLFGTAFIAAAATLFVYRKETGDTSSSQVSGRLVFLSAAACGISLGAKPIYDLYAAAYTVVVLALLYRDLRQKRRMVLVMGSVIVGLLIPSAFWFGRATAATGNPVFPIRVAVRNHVFLPGYATSQITNPAFDQNFVRSRAEWIIYPWTEWERDPSYLMIPYGEGHGLGAVFTSFVPIGLAFLFYRSLSQGGRHHQDRKLLLFLAVLLLAWWFCLSRVPRFGLPIVILACVLTAPLVEALRMRCKRPFAILFFMAVVVTCTISTFVPIHTLLGRIRSRRWARREFYSYPSLLDNLPPGSCVINYTQVADKNFSLAGAGLRNTVISAIEVPNPLTPEFLEQHTGAFVAEIPHATPSPLESRKDFLRLVNEQYVPSGKSMIYWRIWRIEKPDALK
jgi:hypothetical protein